VVRARVADHGWLSQVCAHQQPITTHTGAILSRRQAVALGVACRAVQRQTVVRIFSTTVVRFFIPPLFFVPLHKEGRRTVQERSEVVHFSFYCLKFNSFLTFPGRLRKWREQKAASKWLLASQGAVKACWDALRAHAAKGSLARAQLFGERVRISQPVLGARACVSVRACVRACV
jgi:hypothetical protein